MRTLPKRYRRVYHDALAYRSELQSVVAETHGGVSKLQAHYIDAAVRWEIAAGVAAYVLRGFEDKLDAQGVVGVTEKIAKATAERNRWIEKLDIDSGEQQDIHSIMQSIYSAPRSPQPPAAERSPSTPDDTCDSQARDNEQARSPENDIAPSPDDATN